MSEALEQARLHPVPIPADSVGNLLATAARAPSIFNTQPWLFRVTTHTIELYADPSRKLRSDPAGREMLISCGAALYGLRLAIRALGYQPVVSLLPEPEQPGLLASVRFGAREPVTSRERAMIDALPRRHTHRGGFGPDPLPRGLLIGLQHDAVVEHAALALIDRPVAYTQLASIVAKASASLNSADRSRADVRQWVRLPGSLARDGIPAGAIPASPVPQPGRLVQRDLDLGRGIGQLSADGCPPAATAILLTSADTPGGLAQGRAGPAPAAGPRGDPVGLRQPVLAAARVRADQGADPVQARAAGRAPAAAPVRPGQSRPGDPAPPRVGAARSGQAQVAGAEVLTSSR